MKIKYRNHTFECEKTKPVFKNCLNVNMQNFETFYMMKKNPNRIFVKLKTKYMWFDYMSFDISQIEIIDIKKDRLNKLQKINESTL